MSLTNAQIAAQLEQLAGLLRNQGANRFKVKAYHRAADALRTLPEHLASLLAAGKPLPRIPGVGDSIASAIIEIAASGSLQSITKLEAKLPRGTAAIAQAARIPVRDAQRLAKALGISTVEELRTKLDAGEIGPAVGARLEYRVRQGLTNARRLLWRDAGELSDHFLGILKGIRGVEAVEPAGSLRRGQDTVGTLRFVVRATSPAAVRTALRKQAWVENLSEPSPMRLVSTLAAGPMLVVRLATKAAWGTALAEETASEAHLEELARDAAVPKRTAFATELAWYRARGLPVIAPELREGRGEVAAALDDALPELVRQSDITGDLHAHTTASDGVNSLEEMVAAARTRGYAYLAITDHSKSLKITNGLNEKRLAAQGAEIDALNKKLKGTFRVLKGSEVDILEDGSLDFADAVLRRLEIVMASIHSRFALDKAAQTRRMLNAIANPYVTCIGHLTGRKLLNRPGYELDLDAVLKAVARHGKLLEINASPDRLDVSDELAKKARDLGIPLLINTDAHSIREFDFMAFGIQQARRGWQTPETIVNTRPLADVLRAVAGTRPRAARAGASP